ncbi:MAG: molybdenum ABC transporter permease [Archaeoglobus sp.]|nr:MAG: molybdenum ABC transporter permease [Archaeoglobus sp.]
MKDKNIFEVFLFFLSATIVLFLALPVVCLTLTQFSGVDSFERFISNALLNRNVWDVILLTYLAALVSTVLAIFFGVPLAYILARYDFPAKRVVESFADLPAVIPHTVAGIALLSVLGESGIIGKFSPVQFVDAFPGIVAAMLFVSFPIFLNNAREGFAKVDRRIENVARTLGASNFKAFFSITLPLSARSIVAGAIVAWARAVSEFGAIVVIAYYPLVASTLIYDEYLSRGLVSAEPTAVLLILLTMLIFTVIRFVFWEDKD